MNRCVCRQPVLLLALTVAGISPACREQDRDPNTVTLGVSMASFTAPYASAAVREFKRYAREKDIDLLLLNSQQDIQREAFNIDTLVSRKVDALLVNVVDSKGSRAALKKASGTGLAVALRWVLGSGFWCSWAVNSNPGTGVGGWQLPGVRKSRLPPCKAALEVPHSRWRPVGA